jgi:hypothetical protein
VQTFPAILTRLAAGDVTLTALRRLAPVLTSGNVEPLLAAVRHKSKSEVEQIVAALRPSPDVVAGVRKLPSLSAPPPTVWLDVPTARATVSPRVTPGTPVAPVTSYVRVAIAPAPVAPAPTSSRPPVMAPLSADRYRIQFTASRAMYDKLQRARDLLRHVIPDGDLAAVFDRALDALLADLLKRKLAATARPRRGAGAPAGTRYIPAAIRREVWKRDAARCAFVGRAGRCTERGFLELHHVHPFAAGGQATLENIELRCRAHNAYESEHYFGSFVLRESVPPYGSFRNDGVSWRESGASLGLCADWPVPAEAVPVFGPGTGRGTCTTTSSGFSNSS